MCGGMLPQKILKSRGLEMLFQRFPRAICDLRISRIIYFVHCLSKPMHLESKTLATSIKKIENRLSLYLETSKCLPFQSYHSKFVVIKLSELP